MKPITRSLSNLIAAVELFVHFGIDTVELKGEGFKRIAEEGQRVKVGDTVIEFDLPLLEEKAKSTLTPVVISNMDEIKELIKLSGSVTVGETPVIPHQEVILARSEKWRPSAPFFMLPPAAAKSIHRSHAAGCSASLPVRATPHGAPHRLTPSLSANHCKLSTKQVASPFQVGFYP